MKRRNFFSLGLTLPFIPKFMGKPDSLEQYRNETEEQVSVLDDPLNKIYPVQHTRAEHWVKALNRDFGQCKNRKAIKVDNWTFEHTCRYKSKMENIDRVEKKEFTVSTLRVTSYSDFFKAIQSYNAKFMTIFIYLVKVDADAGVYYVRFAKDIMK